MTAQQQAPASSPSAGSSGSRRHQSTPRSRASSAAPRVPRGGGLTAFALAALALSLSAPAQAKPLYITVNRSFSTTEHPIVDVAFQNRGPVELRVLKPRDLDKYLASQANLRRVWDEPSTAHNPGRALSQGINALRGPGQYLLFALDPKLRTELSPALGERADDDSTATLRVAEGPKKLVGVPEGMELVRSQWLNLDLGGADRAFDVPGFDAWSGDSGFQERRVPLPELPAGVYVLQLVQGNVDGQVVLVVTDLTVAVKQTDGKVLVRAASRAQQPVKGAAITVRTPSGAALTALTDQSGEAIIKTAEPRLLVTVKNGADVALVDTEFFSTLMTTPDLFLYTDRPIYHPGDELQFRGVLRKPESYLARLFVPAKRSVVVELRTDDGGGAKTTVNVDAYGSFSGKLKAPEDAVVGVLRVTATVEGRPYQGETRVQDYVKPTFFIEVTPTSEAIVPGQKIKATLRAERYAGGAPVAGFEVLLTRSSLDTPAWVDDGGKGGQGSAVTYGSASTTEGKLSVPDRVYSSLAERLDKGEADAGDPWASAPAFDEKGNAEIEVEVPALKEGEERVPWRYSLSIRARDDQGTFASSATTLYLSPYEVLGALRVDPKVVRVGGTAALVVRSTTLSGKTAPGIAGSVRFALRNKNGEQLSGGQSQSFTTDESGRATVNIPTTAPGSWALLVTLTDKKGAQWAGEDRLIVVGAAGEAVEWVPELSLLSPTTTLSSGEKVDVVALLPDEWGPGGKNEGPLWLTLSGNDLYETRLLPSKGNTVVVPVKADKRYGSAVYASLSYPTRSGRWEERTVPFRIVPGERVLDVKVEAKRSEAEPNGDQTLTLRVTDASGDGVAASVSIGVVDKAVYAVQAEFRPSILDFFYPITRNNVATFSSMEFQGYGYGHVLARRAARYGDVQFATLKPPKKNQEKDTAYWNGSVVTDDEGNATLSFKLPSNQTLWTVTAVAADTAGRVGEGTAQFATRGNLTLATAVPRFLRVGDQATGIVRVSRPSSSSWKGGALEVATTVGGAAAKKSVELTSGSQLVPLPITATAAGRTDVAVVIKGGPQALSDSKALPVDDGAVSERVRVSAVGGGALALTVPKGARLTDVELVLSPTLADLALGDLRELLVYPYGCLEQLVSTTTPVLALTAALESGPVAASLDVDTQGLLAEARSRAAWGVTRILEHAQKSGGFVWFTGYGNDTPSLEMTLIALNGLVPAHEAGLVSRTDPRVTASLRWLEAQGPLGDPLDAVRAAVLASWEGDKHAARVRTLVTGLTSTSSPYYVAMATIAAERAGVLTEPDQRAQLRSAHSSLRASFLASGAPSSSLSPEVSWRYPLHGHGIDATVARALTLVESDNAPVAKRLRELFAAPSLATFDRATLVLAALPMIEGDAARLGVLKPPSVEVGGAKIELAPRGLGLAAKLPDNSATAKVGSFDGVATLRGVLRTNAADAPALAEGFTLERRYWLVSGDQKTPLDAGASVAQGTTVYVELTLSLNGRRDYRSSYAVLVDPTPAGFSALQEDKEYRGGALALPLAHASLKKRAFTADRAMFFLEEPAWWMDQVRTIGYVMRADFAGTFTAPPASIEDMYWSKARARTTAAKLTVTPSAK